MPNNTYDHLAYIYVKWSYVPFGTRLVPSAHVQKEHFSTSLSLQKLWCQVILQLGITLLPSAHVSAKIYGGAFRLEPCSYRQISLFALSLMAMLWVSGKTPLSGTFTLCLSCPRLLCVTINLIVHNAKETLKCNISPQRQSADEILQGWSKKNCISHWSQAVAGLDETL